MVVKQLRGASYGVACSCSPSYQEEQGDHQSTGAGASIAAEMDPSRHSEDERNRVPFEAT